MSYEVRLPLFEGPLDLLLHLIEKETLDITQVALAQVTDEFLAYVEAMRGHLELDLVADFLAVAARLLWIKSRVLLPRPSSSVAAAYRQEEGEDELVQQLRLYRQYKEAAQALRERDQLGLRGYVRLTPPPRPQRLQIDLSGVTLAQLQAAAEGILYPSEGPRPQEAIQRPRISITQQIRLIRTRLIQWAKVSYSKLLSREPTRVEAVVTLQAILELIKQCAVSATQTQRFGEIVIEPLIPPDQISESAIAAAEAPSPPPANQ